MQLRFNSYLISIILIISMILGACSSFTEPTEQKKDPEQDDVVVNNEPSDDEDSSTNIDATLGHIDIEVKGITSSSIYISFNSENNITDVKLFISPEPELTSEGSYSFEKEITTIANGKNDYIVENLSADTNIFLRLSGTDSSGKKYSGLAHAKTIGGPRAVLDNPLREVHMYAPNIIQLVLSEHNGVYELDGNYSAKATGDNWQNNSWEIKRNNGNTIGVLDVFRNSIPVDAPDYEIGWEAWPNDEVIDVDHNIFIVLSEDVGEKEILSFNGPNDLSFILPFSDKYLETTAVQLNQVGYNPRASKRFAYVSGWMGDGEGLNLDNFPTKAEALIESENALDERKVIVNNLSITSRSDFDDDAKTAVKEINLSSLPTSETNIYRIRIPGVGVSWRTEVSEKSAFRIFYVTARGLFFNRWGGDLRSDLTDFSRPIDHPTIYTGEKEDWYNNADPMYPADQPLVGLRSLAGGYHDAGDFDQRPSHTVIPQLLMRAYELNSDLFLDNQLNIPESVNSIPDLLDEAMWGISAWLSLQESDGGVRLGLESSAHPRGIYFASDDELKYWTFARGADISARAAGLFAQGARLIEPYDATKSALLEARAKLAFEYAINNGAPPAFLLYGAGELFLLTGDEDYKNAFETAWNSIGPYGAFSRFSENHLALGEYAVTANHRVMPDFILGFYKSNGTASIVDKIKSEITIFANTRANSIINSIHAHRNPRPSDYKFTWGQGLVTARYLDTVIARMMIGNLSDEKKQEYFDALSLGTDFILGANPFGYVFITGLGSRRVEQPLHLDSLVFIKEGKGPMPGIPVYGPADGISNAHYKLPLKASFYPSTDDDIYPTTRIYADVRLAVECNEFTSWEVQAPLVQMFSLLIPASSTSEMLASEYTIDGLLINED